MESRLPFFDANIELGIWLDVQLLIIYYLSRLRYNLFTGCPKAKTCTILMRGGAEQFIEETERSLHDAIMIVRRTIKNDAVVAGTVWLIYVT